MSSADFFSKLTPSKKTFKDTIRVSNGLDSVGPDLGPNVCKGYQSPIVGKELIKN